MPDDATADYVELAPPDGAGDVVACRWRHRVTAPRQRIVPDGCVDVIWFDDGRLEVAGPDTLAREQVLAPGSTAYGVRLRPGAAAAALGRDVSELRDRRAEPDEVWPDGDELVGQLTAASPSAVHGLLVGRLARGEPDRLVQRAAALLAEPDGRVGDVAATLGVSARQLQRRCVAAVGYGPKTLAMVLRLQRLQRLQALGGAEASGAPDLATLALDAGYASQAHMGDQVRHLTGLTPARFLERDAA